MMATQGNLYTDKDFPGLPNRSQSNSGSNMEICRRFDLPSEILFYHSNEILSRRVKMLLKANFRLGSEGGRGAEKEGGGGGRDKIYRIT